MANKTDGGHHSAWSLSLSLSPSLPCHQLSTSPQNYGESVQSRAQSGLPSSFRNHCPFSCLRCNLTKPAKEQALATLARSHEPVQCQVSPLVSLVYRHLRLCATPIAATLLQQAGRLYRHSLAGPKCKLTLIQGCHAWSTKRGGSALRPSDSSTCQPSASRLCKNGRTTRLAEDPAAPSDSKM